MKKTTTAFSMVLFGFMTAPVLAGDKGMKMGGSELYQHHGCVNCHGANAKNPVSKVIPVLGGEPSDELFMKAKKILSGEGGSKESEIMHAAFYSPSQCDSPPTDEELHAIVGWISQQ